MHQFRPSVIASLLLLSSCGGEDSSSPAPVAVAPSPTPTPSPSPTPSPTPSPVPPPATAELPPSPFGLTGNADFALLGWQYSSDGVGAEPTYALASDRAALSWSAGLKTYRIDLADLASGKLVYTFGSARNALAYSIVQPDGSVALAYVTLAPKTASVAQMYWQVADLVQPFHYGVALYGIPVPSGALPSNGRRTFLTDITTSPQKSLIIDFVARTVSGSLATFHDGGGWDPEGPKETGTITASALLPDGSFVAELEIAGAPRKGELRGRLYGPAGSDLGLYWNGPVRDGYGDWVDWRTTIILSECKSCP